MLVDSHCHLDFDAYSGELDQVIERAAAAGVGRLLTICTQLAHFERVRGIADRYPAVYCSVGVHPHEAKDEGEGTARRLLECAEHGKVVGFGETGLDFHYNHSPREAQTRVFQAHIAASRQADLPLIVHSRNADVETIEILEEGAKQGPIRGVIHCFSSGEFLAERSLALGFYLSFAGIVTFKKADELRQIAENTPLDRLLIETDAPYLAPVPVRGKRNEPAYVVHTAALLAEVRGISLAEFAAATTTNFHRLFTKVEPSAAR